MTKTLSRKFVRTAMLAISILLILIIGAINVINIVNTDKRAWSELEIISRFSEASKEVPEERPDKPADLADEKIPGGEIGAENPNKMPENNPPQRMLRNEYDTYMASNFFYVEYDENGEVTNADVSRTSIVSEDEAVEMADKAIAAGDEKGRDGDCIYIVNKLEESGACTVVFLDTANGKRAALSVLLVSLLVGLACWILMLLITKLLSKKAIKPIAENIEKQKQFITDAGHEIKTPLAIIQVNSDALELHNGESKWLTNIKTQVERLTKLTNDLLALAKMDEKNDCEKLDNVDLSETLSSIADGFAPTCENRGMDLRSEIDDSLIVKAKQSDIERLIGILIDNAIKYGKPDGIIDVKLNRDNKHVRLSIQNECVELPAVAPDKLFERFYRSDKARTQESGGCGIGLSIAKSIVESAGGTIRAEYIDDSVIKFVVEL